MAQEDLNNNRNVRRVLVRHWIDLGRIAAHSANSKVTIRGTLQLLRGVKHELDSQSVDNIFREINRIPGIKRLNVELDNWICIEGSWQQTEKASGNNSSFESAGTAQTFEI